MTPRMKTPPQKRTTKAKNLKTTPPAAVAEISLKDDVFVGTAEAARLVGKSPKTLRQMRCERTGPRFFKLGEGQRARCAYRRSDLEKWIRSCVVAVGGDA